MNDSSPPNRLAGETSPYLLQHAHNPVDWYPWGEEALELARREDRPILLSIGYSACHWCHVMAHESFEDEATAAKMNALFVNIKVDREERPDLDKVYQLAHQLLARRSGGWPLTVILNPHDHVPFFTGTYFPREPRYNLPGFGQLLDKVADFYRQKKDALTQNHHAFLEALRSVDEPAPAAGEIDTALMAKARLELGDSFDRDNGGFGGAPKFPHPSSLELLLRLWERGGRSDGPAWEIVETSLRKMAEGGIFDQLGGGFCRYSVDAGWQIPHFEKMLYDNGPLLALYAQAAQIDPAGPYGAVAVATAQWVMAEMQSPEGGYYSSLDADSEGEEGKFYVWDRQAVRALLDPEEFQLLGAHFGLDETPNFEGHWHLHIAEALEASAARLGMDGEKARQLLASARNKLLKEREQRIRPGRDDKILSSWNALMIKGMALAGRVLAREDFIASAARAFEFLRRNLWREGPLLATYKDGRARFPAYLDDYAFLMDAGLELLQCRWRAEDLHWIVALAEDLLNRFEDGEQGGFYFTAHDHESLLHRAKPFGDEAVPAGNGIAAAALLRLGHLLGEPRYGAAAERALKAAMPALQRYPSAHASVLIALAEWASPSRTIVLRGDWESLKPWQAAMLKDFAPRRLSLAIPESERDLPGILGERKPGAGVRAYVCEAAACLPPVSDLAEFKALLGDY